jgi:hypothetical protein
MCGIFQKKMLTQTLRTLEQNGIVMRTVYPVIPPQVEYSLTSLGKSLLEVLNLVHHWVREHQGEAEQTQQAFAAAKAKTGGSKTLSPSLSPQYYLFKRFVNYAKAYGLS